MTDERLRWLLEDAVDRELSVDVDRAWAELVRRAAAAPVELVAVRPADPRHPRRRLLLAAASVALVAAAVALPVVLAHRTAGGRPLGPSPTTSTTGVRRPLRACTHCPRLSGMNITYLGSSGADHGLQVVPHLTRGGAISVVLSLRQTVVAASVTTDVYVLPISAAIPSTPGANFTERDKALWDWAAADHGNELLSVRLGGANPRSVTMTWPLVTRAGTPVPAGQYLVIVPWQTGGQPTSPGSPGSWSTLAVDIHG